MELRLVSRSRTPGQCRTCGVALPAGSSYWQLLRPPDKRPGAPSRARLRFCRGCRPPRWMLSAPGSQREALLRAQWRLALACSWWRGSAEAPSVATVLAELEAAQEAARAAAAWYRAAQLGSLVPRRRRVSGARARRSIAGDRGARAIAVDGQACAERWSVRLDHVARLIGASGTAAEGRCSGALVERLERVCWSLEIL